MAEEKDYLDQWKSVQALEKEVYTLKEVTSTHEKRITEHGRQIDNVSKSVNNLTTDIELIKKSSSYTEENTREIKATLKKLEEQNHRDHYIMPLENWKKVTWQVLTLIIVFIFGLLIKDLFPFSN